MTTKEISNKHFHVRTVPISTTEEVTTYYTYVKHKSLPFYAAYSGHTEYDSYSKWIKDLDHIINHGQASCHPVVSYYGHFAYLRRNAHQALDIKYPIRRHEYYHTIQWDDERQLFFTVDENGAELIFL